MTQPLTTYIGTRQREKNICIRIRNKQIKNTWIHDIFFKVEMGSYQEYIINEIMNSIHMTLLYITNCNTTIKYNKQKNDMTARWEQIIFFPLFLFFLHGTQLYNLFTVNCAYQSVFTATTVISNLMLYLTVTP